MTRLRLWRLIRCYHRIAVLERKLGGSLSAAEMRRDFASETVGLVDDHHKRTGWSRQQRRRFRRQIVSGR